MLDVQKSFTLKKDISQPQRKEVMKRKIESGIMKNRGEKILDFIYLYGEQLNFPSANYALREKIWELTEFLTMINDAKCLNQRQ